MVIDTDTIVAIATPPGHGGVGIVRLSGSHALSIAHHLCPSLKSVHPRHAYFTPCIDEQGDKIDEGVIIFFQTPHSYTGEDVIEFQMHGSPWVLSELLRLCQHYGARLARAGEFTERAFLNNKIDLIQAEAVADLIEAQSATAAKMAARTLQGQFSQYIYDIEEELTQLRMYVESTIDFSDEALEWLEQHQWQQRLEGILTRVSRLKAQAHQGIVLQQGLCIVLVGRPNVGKSTLMNAFAKRDVAIVTPIAGTTRDLMRENVLIDDIPVTLIDTAGLRQSNDVIEQEGMKRAWEAISHADLVLFLHDATQKDWEIDNLPLEVQHQLPPQTPVLHVLNKSDMLTKDYQKTSNQVWISAKENLGMENLIQTIKSMLNIERQESDFMARKRHILIFEKIEKGIRESIQQFHIHQAPELLAEDLKMIHQHLSEITGEFSSDDLLGEIFSRFCIGK